MAWELGEPLTYDTKRSGTMKVWKSFWGHMTMGKRLEWAPVL